VSLLQSANVNACPADRYSLHLDVYAPANADKDSALQVKVWIYPGGNDTSCISDPFYDGCSVADAGAIIPMPPRARPPPRHQITRLSCLRAAAQQQHHSSIRPRHPTILRVCDLSVRNTALNPTAPVGLLAKVIQIIEDHVRISAYAS
jgi:hypothetical protein